MLGEKLFLFYIMLLLIRCALGYDMGPGARPVIHPVTAPRNRASEYLGDMACVNQNMWDLPHVGVTVCSGIAVWGLQCAGFAVCGSCGVWE